MTGLSLGATGSLKAMVLGRVLADVAVVLLVGDAEGAQGTKTTA